MEEWRAAAVAERSFASGTDLEDRSLVEELHEVIAQLDEPDKTIVTMKLEGYSYKEIAQELDTTEKNVSVRLVRVKDKLRKEMTK